MKMILVPSCRECFYRAKHVCSWTGSAIQLEDPLKPAAFPENCPLPNFIDSTNKDREKYLVEAVGGCWHEWETREKYLYRCKKCHLLCAATTLENCRQIDLSTWKGFEWLWERVKKKEWWEKFVADHSFMYHIRFYQELYDFLKEQET